MPRVRVNLFAQFRELTGVKHVELELKEGATVMDMLREIEERYPRMRGRLTSEGAQYVLMKGGQWPKKEDRVEDGDVYALFPIVGGG